MPYPTSLRRSENQRQVEIGCFHSGYRIVYSRVNRLSMFVCMLHPRIQEKWKAAMYSKLYPAIILCQKSVGHLLRLLHEFKFTQD